MRKNPKCLLPTCCLLRVWAPQKHNKTQTFETLEYLQTRNTMELFWLNFFVAVGTTPRYMKHTNHQVFRSFKSVSLFVVDLQINQKTQPKSHEKNDRIGSWFGISHVKKSGEHFPWFPSRALEVTALIKKEHAP